MNNLIIYCNIHFYKHFRTYYRAKKAFDDYVMQIFSDLLNIRLNKPYVSENLKGSGNDTKYQNM